MTITNTNMCLNYVIHFLLAFLEEKCTTGTFQNLHTDVHTQIITTICSHSADVTFGLPDLYLHVMYTPVIFYRF